MDWFNIIYKPYYTTKDFLRYNSVYNNKHKIEQYADRTKVEILDHMVKEISKKMVREATAFQMPGKLGTLSVRRNKLNIKNKLYLIDVYATEKHGKTIYQIFDKTDQWYPKVVWGPNIFMVNRAIYRFRPNSSFKKYVWLYFKKGYRRFMEAGNLNKQRYIDLNNKRKEKRA